MKLASIDYFYLLNLIINMCSELSKIIELTELEEFKTTITYEQIILAKDIINSSPKSKEHLLLILCSMNLINSAIKRKEFKEVIHYGMLKPKVSKLLIYLLEHNDAELDIQFYINESQKCAYIENYGLQFSFHNITIYEKLKDFINSPLNKPADWKGVPLQKIASELFEYAIKKTVITKN
jgi:hypothetical protein